MLFSPQSSIIFISSYGIILKASFQPSKKMKNKHPETGINCLTLHRWICEHSPSSALQGAPERHLRTWHKGPYLCTSPESADSSRSSCHCHHFRTTTLTSHAATSSLGDTRFPKPELQPWVGQADTLGSWFWDATKTTQASVTLQVTETKQWTQNQSPEGLITQELDNPGTQVAANHLLMWPLHTEHILKQRESMRS